ncbi:MAG: hypothetical protein RRB22_04915 [Gammaproteobacteria bacterium]|nr:hypothetical protein [Gammaproteobacteria bacterium]
MKESDWKIFKEIKEKAIKLFCSRALEEFNEIIKDKNSKPEEAYTLLYRIVINRDKQMSLLFDSHSRSKATLQLLAIRGENLADQELLKKLSSEFLEVTDPRKVSW